MAPVNSSAQLHFGPLLTGCCFDILFQGILFVQFTTYFEHFNDDRPFLKLTVVGLVLLTTLKSCQSFAMLWIEFIGAFGDLNLASNTLLTALPIRTNSLWVASLGFYTRAYFCYRLFFLSKAWWAVAIVVSTEALALGFISFAVYVHDKDAADAGILLYYTLYFSVIFVGDLLLTLLTAFFLTRSKKDVLPRAHGVIDALIRLSVETAAPGAICSLINLTVSQLPEYFQLLAGFNGVLPKLYAVSMMWTLNARHELRSLPWGNRSTLSYIDIASGNESRSNGERGNQVDAFSNAFQKDTHVDDLEGIAIPSGSTQITYTKSQGR